MNDDLISREALKKLMWDESYPITTFTECGTEVARIGLTINEIEQIIDNAPTVPQGEYVDISKLRLMTVEECAGHTIDYAMGWKACIEWIKKGGADMRGSKG